MKRYALYGLLLTGLIAIAALLGCGAVEDEAIEPAGFQAAVPEWVFWLAPTIIGVPVLIRWRGHYQRKFSKTATAAGS